MKYTCENCDYTSNDKSNYKRHLKARIHSAVDKKHLCKACGKIYASRQGLSRHKLNSCIKTQNIQNESHSEIKKLEKQVAKLTEQVMKLIKIVRNTEQNNTVNTIYNILIENYIQIKSPNDLQIQQI